MPPSLPQWLSVVTFEPRIGSAAVPTLPTIRVRFNTDLDQSLVNTDPALAQQVILVRMDTDEAVPVTFVSYDAGLRLLAFKPTATLVPGAFYQVTLRKTLKNAQGRAMAADRIWSFQVDASPIGDPELLAPGDSTAHASAPTLSWQGVSVSSGSVTYDLQVDDNWGFGSDLVWETSITAAASAASGIQTATIGVSLTSNRAYYWRVRARTASVTGDWTPSWAFWLGTTSQIAPETQLAHAEVAAFRLVDLQPPNGAYHLSDWPTILGTFSQALSGGTLTSANVQLWKEAIDGSLSSGAALVSGTVLHSGNVLELRPAGAIEKNTRYTIVLRTGIASVSGDYLPEEVVQYFTGPYSPLYGGVIAVRALHGGCCDDVATDEILFQLWRASLEVHRIILAAQETYPETITLKDLLDHKPTEITWGMVRYAEHAAAVSVLEGHYFDLLESAGTRKALGVYEFQRSTEILPELRAKLAELKKERDEIAATMLRQLVQPRVTQKSQLWHPSLSALDRSYKPRSSF